MIYHIAMSYTIYLIYQNRFVCYMLYHIIAISYINSISFNYMLYDILLI